jgi:hypothetical protein
MRITRAGLNRRWEISVLLAVAAFAVLAVVDADLKRRSGLGAADVQGFALAAQYRLAAVAWSKPSMALEAGFALGFDYLFMPLYAFAFFFSGIQAREAFATRPSSFRRILTLLAAVPIAGAVLDALENGLELWLLLNGASDTMARLAFTISNAKMLAIYVGLVLLAGAILARAQERQQRRMNS